MLFCYANTTRLHFDSIMDLIIKLNLHTVCFIKPYQKSANKCTLFQQGFYEMGLIYSMHALIR